MNPLKITFSDLSTQETDIIFAGLGSLPMAQVEQLVNKLRQQVAIQVSQYQAKIQKESEQTDGNPVQ